MTIVLSILLLISLFLESIIPNLLSGFIPFFMIAIIVIGSMLEIDDNKYYVTIFIFGVLYDLAYFSTLFLNGFIFLFIGYLSKLITSNNVCFIKNVFFYYVLSLVNVLSLYFFTFLYAPLDVMLIFNKILSSLFINTLYFTFFYFIFIGIKKIISNRRKKRSYF